MNPESAEIQKRQVLLADGRYLIYYTFRLPDPTAVLAKPTEVQERERPTKGEES